MYKENALLVESIFCIPFIFNFISARQCSPRGGNLDVHVLNGRVALTGNAVIVVQGTIAF